MAKTKKRRKPQIIEKKIGRSGAIGLCYPDGRIYIDPRQLPKEYFGSCIHELSHFALPELSESKIKKLESILKNGLWKLNYRKVSQ